MSSYSTYSGDDECCNSSTSCNMQGISGTMCVYTLRLLKPLSLPFCAQSSPDRPSWNKNMIKNVDLHCSKRPQVPLPEKQTKKDHCCERAWQRKLEAAPEPPLWTAPQWKMVLERITTTPHHAVLRRELEEVVGQHRKLPAVGNDRWRRNSSIHGKVRFAGNTTLLNSCT